MRFETSWHPDMSAVDFSLPLWWSRPEGACLLHPHHKAPTCTPNPKQNIHLHVLLMNIWVHLECNWWS